MLTREQLIEKIEELEYWPEFATELDWYLRKFLYDNDLEMISILLQAGANRTPEGDLSWWIFPFLQEYVTNRTLHGELILNIVELLLKHGANPNLECSGNLRAYDFAIYFGAEPFSTLLEKYGANRQLRERE